MARIELAAGLVADFDRNFDHLARVQTDSAAQRIEEIIAAPDVLQQNPLIGRPVTNGKRELVIGPRSNGYLAWYRYVAEMDTGFVLAIRSQREAGYADRGGHA